jgi:hypothetical protein
VDPVLEIYRLYDRLLEEFAALEPAPRLMLATGLHQDPVSEPVFYWRLREHEAFLRRIGCRFASVEPRMSRDFLLSCGNAADAAATAARLQSGRAPDGLPLFDVDNRGRRCDAFLPARIKRDANFDGTHRGSRARGGVRR